MPNKTIYVSEDDLPLFERAQELSGESLSAAIVQALRRFIELEEARKRGFEDITVLVNGEGAHQRKRFLGYRLARWLQPTPNRKGTEVLNVYRTAGGRFALHTRTLADWPFSGGDPDIMGNPKNWGVGSGLLQRITSWGFDWEAFRESGNYTLQVFDTLEALKAAIPEDLYKAVSLAMEWPEVEALDI